MGGDGLKGYVVCVGERKTRNRGTDFGKGESKMKRTIPLVLACILIVSMFTGCTTPAEPDNAEGPVVVNVAMGGEPRTIDSLYATNILSWDIIRHMQEGLLRIGPTGSEVVPGIAEKWDVSENETHYIFHLRETYWSNGEKVTTHDFEYAWKQALNPEIGAPFAGNMFVVKNGQKYNAGECSAEEVGVKAVDDATLEVYTEYYAPYFLTLCSTPLFMPINKEFYESQGENYAMEAVNMICCGPWKITGWVHQESVTLEKNEDYYATGDIKIDTILMRIVADSSTQYNMFRAGEVDFCGVSGLAEIAQVKAAGYEIEYTSAGCTAFIEINQTANPVLANKNFRKALANGVNRGLYLSAMYGDQLTAATGLNPRDVKYKDVNYFEVVGEFMPDNQIEKGKEYLALALDELGYSDVSQLPTLILNTTSGYEPDVAFLQEQWKVNLGVNVEVRTLPKAASNEAYHSGDFEMSIEMYGYDYPYPTSLLTIYLSHMGAYDGIWSSSEYDELYKVACYSTDDDEKLRAIIDMETMLMEDVVCIPFYHTQRASIKPVRVKNAIRSELANLYLYYAYVEN